ELVLALNGVGACTGNGGADRDRVPLRAGRPSANWRLVVCVGSADLTEKPGNPHRAGRGRAKLQRAATRNHAGALISKCELSHPYPPVDGWSRPRPGTPYFAASFLARNRANPRLRPDDRD